MVIIIVIMMINTLSNLRMTRPLYWVVKSMRKPFGIIIDRDDHGHESDDKDDADDD